MAQKPLRAGRTTISPWPSCPRSRRACVPHRVHVAAGAGEGLDAADSMGHAVHPIITPGRGHAPVAGAGRCSGCPAGRPAQPRAGPRPAWRGWRRTLTSPWPPPRIAARWRRRILAGEGAWAWDATMMETTINEAPLRYQGQSLRIDRLVHCAPAARDARAGGCWTTKAPPQPERQPALMAQLQRYRAAVSGQVHAGRGGAAFLTGDGRMVMVHGDAGPADEGALVAGTGAGGGERAAYSRPRCAVHCGGIHTRATGRARHGRRRWWPISERCSGLAVLNAARFRMIQRFSHECSFRPDS
jgi:hypothetical protein